MGVCTHTNPYLSGTLKNYSEHERRKEIEMKGREEESKERMGKKSQ